MNFWGKKLLQIIPYFCSPSRSCQFGDRGHLEETPSTCKWHSAKQIMLDWWNGCIQINRKRRIHQSHVLLPLPIAHATSTWRRWIYWHAQSAGVESYSDPFRLLWVTDTCLDRILPFVGVCSIFDVRDWNWNNVFILWWPFTIGCRPSSCVLLAISLSRSLSLSRTHAHARTQRERERKITDYRWSEKLTGTFGSGELKQDTLLIQYCLTSSFLSI